MKNVEIGQLFSEDYDSARKKFLDAASAAGSTLKQFKHDRFPELFCDVGIIEKESKQALITISGTHGIEGYCGSAIQTNLLYHQRVDLHLDLFQLHIHGLNPWGMKWLSRYNEDNVDINRNFIDFSSTLPVNKPYKEIHQIIDFPTWNRKQLEQFWLFHQSFVSHNGLRAWNVAFSGGQYAYPNGLMFGGLSHSWSNSILRKIREILPDNIASVVVIDLHSGIGKFGNQLIFVNHISPKADLTKLIEKIKGKSTLIFDTENLPINTDDFSGLVVDDFQRSFPRKSLTLVVEYGTYNYKWMSEAIIYDRWSRYHQDLNNRKYREFLLEMYCPKNQVWRQKVLDHSLELIAQMSMEHED